MRLTIILLSILLLNSCDKNTVAPVSETIPEIIVPTSTSYYVSTIDDMPICDHTREGWLFFVANENGFRACVANDYIIVSTAPTIKHLYTCSTITADLDDSDTKSLKGISTNVYQYSNNDYFMDSKSMFSSTQFTFINTTSCTGLLSMDRLVNNNYMVVCESDLIVSFNINNNSVTYTDSITGGTETQECDVVY